MDLSKSTDFMREVRRRPKDFYVIHYSCQSLYDDNDGLSPRITSIAIAHLATGQTVSFSTHSIAEELGIQREEVRDRFDDIEKRLLEQFYEFIRDRRDKFWVHWNMRNLTFGFEHIAHRYRMLHQAEPPIIPVERRINLNDVLVDRFGEDYAGHPRMTSLMNLNGGLHRHFLDGPQEIEAFNQGEFIKMHNSTLSKVGFFCKVIDRLLKGKLKTSARGYGVMLDRLLESRQAKGISLAGTVLGIILAVVQFLG